MSEFTTPPTPRSQEIPWTKCWRNIYAAEAKALGFRCEWNSGSLLIRTGDGRRIGSGTPEGKTFAMSDFIHKIRVTRNAEDAQKRREAQKAAAEKEERLSELYSRAAAGEAIFCRPKQREERHPFGSRALFSWMLPAIAMGALGGYPYTRRNR